MDLSVTASSMTVKCQCGAEVVLHNVHDGWQHIRFCDDCDPIAQTAPLNWPPSVPA